MGLVTILLLAALSAVAGEPAAKPEPPKPAPAAAAPGAPEPSRRTELNLLGQTDSKSGEARRNENVQFNPIDNNALKELNIRMGTTATIVEEFRVDRNYFGAEFGNRPPSSLHAAASKVLGLHGNLFETHNNSIFSARSFFQAGGVQPARENEYGFAVGVPLWRGASLSLDGSQQKIRGSVNGNVLVPRLDERTALTTDPATRRIVERFLAAYPVSLPNRTDINERALNANAPQVVDTDNTGGRWDQILNQRDRLSLLYRFTDQNVDAFQFVAGQNPNTTTKAHTARLTWNRAWSGATVTDFSVGFDRLRSLLVAEPNAVGPQVSIGSVITGLGPASSIPIDRVQNGFRYSGQMSQLRGKHALKAGFDLLRRQINGRESSSHRGVLYFLNDFGRDAMTNFRMGIPSRYSFGLGDTTRGFRNWDMGYFLGDTWKARPNLTLSYGLRYQPVTTPVEINGLNVVPYPCNCANFAPRFGFAYRLPDEWGVLRAAYGMHYGEIYPVTFQQVRFNPPRVLKIELHSPSLANPLGQLTAEDLSPNGRSTVFDIDRHLSTPYSHQYNFSWEPQVFGKAKLQIGYVGSRSHRLLMMWFNNRAVPVAGIPQTTATINDRRPDPSHFDVRRVLNGSRGYFDAARASLILPRWKGVDLDASYWFSKAIDLGGSYTNPASSTDTLQVRSQAETLVAQDLRSLSSFDQPHALLLRSSYVVPGLLGRLSKGWNISAVALFKSGTPFDVFSGSDAPGYGNVDGSMGDRPNILDPSILGRAIGNPNTSSRLLPRSAFGFMGPTDLRGNLGHNVFRKGGIHNVNASLSRTWALRSDKTITLRVESLNFLNTAQFAEPGKELTAPDFGQITNTLNDGRTFRFLLRFGF